MDIAEFLAARLDEDQRTAEVAAPAPWRTFPNYPGAYVVADADGAYIVNESEHGDVIEQDAEHIARHDPARVLADVAAKRAIIEEIQGMEDRIDGEWGNGTGFGDHESALRYLAAPYSAHPDFDPSWRVEVSA